MSFTLSDLSSTSVLTVGDVMLDRYWFGDVDRISPEAPVPVVNVTREEYRLGGAANVALNVASLGAKSALLGVVGRDRASQQIRTMLSDSAIEDHLKEDPALQTTVKLRVSGRSQQLLRIDFENQPAFEVLASLADQFRSTAENFDAVLFSDYGKGGLTHVSTMVQQARSQGRPVLIDPKGRDYTAYHSATVITPNRSELAQVVGAWSGEDDLERRAQKLRNDLKLDALLVTRSEEGMSLFDDQGHLRVNARAHEVFDVTGAGDTVIAALAVMLAAGASLREAVPVANEAAGIVVAKFGTATASFGELFQ